MIGPAPRRFRREPEPPGRSRYSHQKRAGLGCWAATRSDRDRRAIKTWKRTAPFDPAPLAGFSAAVVELVGAWSPVLPAGAILTVPPQGALAPGPCAARALGVPIHAPLVTNVQNAIEPRADVEGASVDPTEARNDAEPRGKSLR